MIALTTDQIAKIAGDPQACVEAQWNSGTQKWEVIPSGSSTIYFLDSAEPDEVGDLRRQRDAYLDRAMCAEKELEALQWFMRGAL
jgi:hypothetical protein